MPTYEYKCDKCDDSFEEMHSIEDRVESCPKCGGKVRRLFHPVGIIFKGSGFYKTDSRGSSDNGGAKADPKKMEEEVAKTKDKVKDKGSGDKKGASHKKNDVGSSS